MLRLVESPAIYTVFVGLTFDVLVAEQIGGGLVGTGHGTRGLSGEMRSVMMSLILCLDVHQQLVNGCCRRVMKKPRSPCCFWKTKPSQMFSLIYSVIRLSRHVSVSLLKLYETCKHFKGLFA